MHTYVQTVLVPHEFESTVIMALPLLSIPLLVLLRTSSSVAIATWDSSLFVLPLYTCTSSLTDRPVRINSFCFSIDGESKTHLLADVSWFKCHPKNTHFGKLCVITICLIHLVFTLSFQFSFCSIEQCHKLTHWIMNALFNNHFMLCLRTLQQNLMILIAAAK